jgi:hypothetical protein
MVSVEVTNTVWVVCELAVLEEDLVEELVVGNVEVLVVVLVVLVVVVVVVLVVPLEGSSLKSTLTEFTASLTATGYVPGGMFGAGKTAVKDPVESVEAAAWTTPLKLMATLDMWRNPVPLNISAVPGPP